MEDSDLQSTHSGAVIGSNEDLLTEILIRLPATSILRFKSICKHWRSLLSHKHFTHRYDINNNNNNRAPGIFAGSIYVPFDVETRSRSPLNINNSLDFYFKRFDVRIIQSCNGLLLCYVLHKRPYEYYVFNPTTKQQAIIPPPPKGRIRFMALAFHQTHCVHYKLVSICALKPHENMMFQIQVYSSETRNWNICVESFSMPRPIFYDPVYWNGAVYWPPYYRNRNYLYFRLDVEQLQALPVPKGLVDDEVLMYFGESRGHLHFTLRTKRGKNCLVVYEMLMDHSGWFVKYRVQLDELQVAFPDVVSQCGYNFEVVDAVRGKEEEDTFLVLSTPGKMIRYNVHDKSVKELYSKKYCLDLVSSFHRYIEALSSF